MSDPALRARLEEIRGVVAVRQQAGGWTHPVRIVAVTKGHGPDAVMAAAAAGLDTVGENRVQEALEKQGQCAGVPVEWHLIGTLQKNKARLVAGRFEMIHSIDRLDLAIEVARRTPTGARQQVLVQVNCSNEAQKGGVPPQELAALLDGMRTLSSLEVRGLMTMAEFSDDERVQRAAFGQLRRLRDAMTSEGHRLPELSMGMSGDYGAATEEGATMLRLGSILFGARP
jgi:pyridoxal phosphate enzyme (YggS family)